MYTLRRDITVYLTALLNKNKNNGKKKIKKENNIYVPVLYTDITPISINEIKI